MGLDTENGFFAGCYTTPSPISLGSALVVFLFRRMDGNTMWKTAHPNGIFLCWMLLGGSVGYFILLPHIANKIFIMLAKHPKRLDRQIPIHIQSARKFDLSLHRGVYQN